MSTLVPWSPIRRVAVDGGESSTPYVCLGMPYDRDAWGFVRSSTHSVPGFRLRPSAAGAVPQSVLYSGSFCKENLPARDNLFQETTLCRGRPRLFKSIPCSERRVNPKPAPACYTAGKAPRF